MAFMVERFAYIMALAHITMGAESDDWVQHDAAKLFPIAKASRTTGCVHEMFQLIPQVSIVARRRSSEASYQTSLEYDSLQAILQSWRPTSTDEIENKCGHLYQQALLVYLASVLDCQEVNYAGYSEQVQASFDSFIPFLETISPDSPISRTLCWPLAIFGSCAQTQEHRSIITQKLDILSTLYPAHSLRETKVLLEKLWASPASRSPLDLETLMEKEKMTVLFF